MIKRFIKRNLFLVGVMGFSALGIAILLILSGLQYIEMIKCSSETEEMTSRKNALERQRPAAIRENIGRLQHDIDGYTTAYDSIKKYFGQTLQPALDLFVARLNEFSQSKLYEDFALIDEEFRTLYQKSLKDNATAARLPDYIKIYLRDKFNTAYGDAEQRVNGLRKQLAAAKPGDKAAVQKELNEAIAVVEAFKRLARYNEGSVQILTSALLQEKFRIFREGERASQGPREQTYRRFRALGGAMREGERKFWTMEAWDEAMIAFETEAQKTTMEKIDDRNREEVFLASLGLERNMGQSQPRLAAFAREMQSKVVELLTETNDISMMGVYFTAGAVPALKTNKDFKDISESRDNDQAQSQSRSSGTDTNAGNDNPADVIRHWEIVSDIARRLVATKINSLEDLSYINLQGREENGCKYYTYALSVVGSMSEVRDLLNSFSNAYKDNRMYVIRRITLNKQEDQVQDIIDVAQGILGDKGEEASKLSIKNENAAGGVTPGEEGETKAKIIAPATYFKEKGIYGECVAGRSNLCNVSIILDYVVYSANILK